MAKLVATLETQHTQTAPALQAEQLTVALRSGKRLLHDVSLTFSPGELVAILGPSGAGKTTLLNALAGYRRASSGRVFVGGEDAYQQAERLRTQIGFVPQRDIIHLRLTVWEALDYAAQLRMPPETTPSERATRVRAILADLGLAERRDQIVESLSVGQQKRVSIGVELITKPPLLFLDEPTAGLDPGAELGIMRLLRALADAGHTVIVATHATKNLRQTDRIVFLTTAGQVAWFGPPDEALLYFAPYARGRIAGDTFGFDDIYGLIDRVVAGDDAWATRFRECEPVTGYGMFPPAAVALPSTSAIAAAGRLSRKASPARPSALRQLAVLIRRNVRLLTRDRFALLLMLLAAPLLAMLDFAITRRDMFSLVHGDAARIVTNTNTLIVNAMLVGALAQMREIIKDRDIYRRERFVALGIGPYVLSKVAVAAVLALYQAVWWVLIRYLAVDMPGDLSMALGIYVTVALATMAGMMLGLFASAIAPSEQSVALLVALLIIPQVLFSGAHLPVQKLPAPVQSEMAVMPSRWAFEALSTQYGYGASMARDRCWQLPASQRVALTDPQKQGCSCLGANIFTACSFPGIRAYAGLAGSTPSTTGPPAAPGPSAIAIAEAESRLATDFDNYGRVYDVNVASRWLAQLAIIAGLIVIVFAIQHAKARSMFA